MSNKTVEEAVVTREELLELGAEINTLIFAGEEVDYGQLDDESLEAQIRQDCVEIDPADRFSEGSKTSIKALGIEVEWAAAAKKPAAKKPAAKKPAGEKHQGPVFELNKQGHRKGSMTDIIDQNLAKGTIPEKCAENINKSFPNKTREACLAKFHTNVKAYIKEDAQKIVHNKENNTYKFAE